MSTRTTRPDYNQHLEDVHRFSSRHRDAIEASEWVGCYYCERIFDPSGVELAEWIDDGETLMCPFCGIDSCIGTASINPITSVLLKKMNDYWFGTAYNPKTKEWFKR